MPQPPGLHFCALKQKLGGKLDGLQKKSIWTDNGRKFSVIMLSFPSCSLHKRLNTFSFFLTHGGKSAFCYYLLTHYFYCVSHDTCSGTQAEVIGQDPGTNSVYHACVIWAILSSLITTAKLFLKWQNHSHWINLLHNLYTTTKVRNLFLRSKTLSCCLYFCP